MQTLHHEWALLVRELLHHTKELNPELGFDSDPATLAFFYEKKEVEPIYPSELKNWNLGSAKASGCDLSKPAQYYNIGPVSKVKSRKLSLEPNSNSSAHLGVYSVQLQAGKFEKEAIQPFFSGTSDHCLWQGSSEDKNFDAKLTDLKFQLSTQLDIKSHILSSNSIIQKEGLSKTQVPTKTHSADHCGITQPPEQTDCDFSSILLNHFPDFSLNSYKSCILYTEEYPEAIKMVLNKMMQAIQLKGYEVCLALFNPIDTQFFCHVLIGEKILLDQLPIALLKKFKVIPILDIHELLTNKEVKMRLWKEIQAVLKIK